jgi:hypothetical protein
MPRSLRKVSRLEYPEYCPKENTYGLSVPPKNYPYLVKRDAMKQRTSVIDSYLSGKTAETDPRLDAMLNEGIPTGSRVAFQASMETVLTYQNHPSAGSKGYVVKVVDRLANSHRDSVWVKFDDGNFGLYKTAHLKRVSDKTASNFAFSVSSMDDIFNLYSQKNASTLIRKAEKDLWSFEKVGDQYVIERLFDDSGEPLKEA